MAEIKVLDIVEAVDGPVCIIDCSVDPNYCDRSSRCEAIGIWRMLNERIVRTLASQTLEDLATRSSGAAAPNDASVPVEQKANQPATRFGRGMPCGSSRSFSSDLGGN